MNLSNINIRRLYQGLNRDERFNFITHFVGLILNLSISPFLIYYAESKEKAIAFVIYSIGATFMFAGSSFYHLANEPSKKRIWQLFDYIAIFILIGCSYTSYIYLYLNNRLGHIFLIIHWSLIAFGIIFRVLEKTKFKAVSLTLYIFLGWMVILIFKDITADMPYIVKSLLLAGGISYTIGVYFFIHPRIPLSHAIWHVFVILGVTSHYLSLYYS